MSLIPGIGQQNVGGGSATDTGATDTSATDTTDTTGLDTGASASTAPNVTRLGNGYSLVTWTVKVFDPVTNSMVDKQQSQIVPDKDAASVAAVEAAKIGAGAAGLSASISTAGANQRAAAQAEIDKAKNAADEAHNAGLLALQNGNAAEARRQFDISQQELQRYHSMDIGIRQQEQNLASSKFGNDVYNKLTDLASNPRNFMEQFFRMRGQPAPAGSAQYGNTSVTGPGLATFEQFLPNFLRATGLGGGAIPSSGVSTSAASGPTTNQFGSTQNNPANPYAGTNVNYGGSPTTADTAMIGGVKTWAGGPYSGKPVDQTPANAGDLTPYLKNPNLAPPQMARGGSVQMTAPHALVNLLSGKVAAIAGEAGPETAKFNGAAIIDPKEGIAPVAPDGSADGGWTPNDTYTVNPTQTATAASGLGTPAVLGQTVPGVIPADAPQTWTPEDLAAMIAAANAGNAASQPATTMTGTSAPDTYVNQPGPPPLPPITPLPQAPTAPFPPLPPLSNLALLHQELPPVPPPQPPFQLPNLPGVGPGPTTENAPNPGPSPAPVVTPTNIPNPAPTFNIPDFLRETPSGLGKNPSFLPENLAAEDPIIAEMLKQGAFPPFLQRIFAQGRGLAGLGTNTPQATDLPPGVPLVSKLAFGQMTPSEQAAFTSFISAHGLSPEDYFSLVEAASPQGGTGSKTPAIPQFLRQ